MKKSFAIAALACIGVLSPVQAQYSYSDADKAFMCCWGVCDTYVDHWGNEYSNCFHSYCATPRVCATGSWGGQPYNKCHAPSFQYSGSIECVPTSLGSFVLEDFVQKAVGGYCDPDDPNVSATIEVSGHQYAQCINKGGNVAPGRGRIGVSTSATLQSSYCAHGKFHFATSVEDNREFSLDQVPISSSPKELGCPNGNWDLWRVDGKVQAATDEAGNAYTDWDAMNIWITRENGETVESRACCVTLLEDTNPKFCEHEFCNVKDVPDATSEGHRAGELVCGVRWSSDWKCDDETGTCPVGSICGQGNTCQAISCAGDATVCPEGSECAHGICVPSCGS